MVRAVVQATDEQTTVELCPGPLAHGGCPMSPPGSPVACAGREVVIISDSDTTIAKLRVEPDAQACPIAALGLVTTGQPQPAEHDPLTLRDVVARVNLRDFGQMIGGEVLLVGTSLRMALQSRSLAGLLALPVAFIRLALLAAVTVVLGAAITLVTVIRGAAGFLGSVGRTSHR